MKRFCISKIQVGNSWGMKSGKYCAYGTFEEMEYVIDFYNGAEKTVSG
jgi:hypothetical protein